MDKLNNEEIEDLLYLRSMETTVNQLFNNSEVNLDNFNENQLLEYFSALHEMAARWQTLNVIFHREIKENHKIERNDFYISDENEICFMEKN